MLLLKSRDVGENSRGEIDTFVASRPNLLSEFLGLARLFLTLLLHLLVHVVDVRIDVGVICSRDESDKIRSPAASACPLSFSKNVPFIFLFFFLTSVEGLAFRLDILHGNDCLEDR